MSEHCSVLVKGPTGCTNYKSYVNHVYSNYLTLYIYTVRDGYSIFILDYDKSISIIKMDNGYVIIQIKIHEKSYDRLTNDIVVHCRRITSYDR